MFLQLTQRNLQTNQRRLPRLNELNPRRRRCRLPRKRLPRCQLERQGRRRRCRLQLRCQVGQPQPLARLMMQ